MPGQFVSARLVVERREDGITIPAQAIQKGPDGAYVYVVGDDRTVTLRPVTIAQIDDATALIEHGVAVGETVVTLGQFKLQPGGRVVVRPADAPPPA